MNKINTFWIALLGIVALGVVAIFASGIYGGTGKMTLLFSDKVDTTTLSRVDITVDKVKVHLEGTGGKPDTEVNDSVENESEQAKEVNDTDAEEVSNESERVASLMDGGLENPDQWVTLVDTPHSYNLLDLVNNPTQVFAGATLAPGKYTQIRLQISQASITFTNGTKVNAAVPSNRFYWVRSFEIVQGKTTTLTLDFNASASIDVANGQYILHPVARIISTTS